ncbi:TRAP transporter substrate-binding protein [Alkalihalobacillus sp. CinArs1]|uniref:TRAP transporter substrate-binding protein n=1 Tax=Alkalihalobacillus sp. CinArs1 TaxID=2995314 RepID=UPI0022DCE480|nr:TRAP transporter substrate-binding protein [Alkalihalobacillus sp. CinArs1]
MKNIKKKVLGAVSVLSLGALVACGGTDQEASSNGEAASNDTKTLQVGITLAEDSHYYKGLEHFGELVEEKSDGELAIEIFPNGSLGGERDMVESLQVGSLDMVLSSTGPLGGFAPEINVVDLPFLFESREHAYKVLDGEIGQSLLTNLEDQSLKGLAWWENGFRHVTNSERAIEKPEDLEGLKIRTMENNVHQDSFKALGADPTPMSFTELFTALQQGVVDGQENPVPIISTSRFYEVQDHLTLTGHFYSPAALLVSSQVFDGLTEDQQKALQEAAVEGAEYERELVAEMEQEMISGLKDEGMNVVEEVDKKAFQKATESVYETYADQVGEDLIKKIQDAANE